MPAHDKVDAVLDGGSVAPWDREGDSTSVPDVEVPQGATGIMVEENTSLMVPEDSAPVSMQFKEDLDFDLSELRIPYLKLLSGTSPEVTSGEGKAGQWYLQGHGPTDEVVFTVLGASRFRELREDMNIPNARTLCKSVDGIVGVGAPGGLCAKCPFSAWGEKNPTTGKGTPPPCNAGFQYQIYSFTHQQPAILAMRKSGIDAAKTINTALHLRKAKNFISIMGHVDKPSPVNPRATYPAPYVVNRPITKEEKEEANQAAEALLGTQDI
jgi:hypothetical protein